MTQSIHPDGNSAPQAGQAQQAAAGARAVSVRNTVHADIPAVRELQRIGYPTLRPWSVEQIENQLKVFPEGQFVAEIRGVVVGAASSLIVQWDDYAVDHTLKEVTGSGTFSTHDVRGRTLYGAEVIVSRKLRGSGVGRALYRARRQLCTRLGLRRIVAGGRLPGYHKYADTLTPEMYAMRVIWGDIVDPVLRFQMSQGFHYCGILRDYLPDDTGSCGNAAFIAPSDFPFARDGIAAEGLPNTEQIIVADVNLALLGHNRINGTTIPLFDKRKELYDAPIQIVAA